MKKHIIKIGTIIVLIIGLIIFSLQVSIVYPQSFTNDALVTLRSLPSIKAFLDTISYAEATYGKDGYLIQYTGLKFDSFKDHPRHIICALYKGEQLCSSAAGRYQFLKSTWDRIASKINASDFTPINQDRGAIELLRENDAVEPLLAGNFKEALTRVNKVWASLPGAPYGQPTKSYQELKNVYQQRLKRHTHFGLQENKETPKKNNKELSL